MSGTRSVFQVGEDIKVYQVVVVLNALAVSLLVFEHALHQLEHYLSAHHDKYQIMLKKVYRELMILGLLGFIVKMLTEVGGMYTYDSLVVALQVADLIIFILAIILIVQACIVLVLLRRHNKRVDLAELVSTQDLIDMMNVPEDVTLTSRGNHLNHMIAKENVVKHRILRHLFLRRFGLPHLFPFSKYLRHAQVNNVVHITEIEPSMWLLVLGISWAFCGVFQLLHDDESEAYYQLRITLVVFSWMLVLVNISVALYFRFCMYRLLKAGGYSTTKAVLMNNLTNIAEKEAIDWDKEAADDTLDTMNQILAQHEEREVDLESTKQGILKDDSGARLVATCFHNAMRIINSTECQTLPNGVLLDESPEIHLPGFSWNAWHIIVTLTMILNAFFATLFIQGVVYSLDEIYTDAGIFPVLSVPLPLLLNAFFLHKRISRDFVMISSIVRIDVSVLGEVVSHFSEVVELRSEFATVLLQCMNENRRSVADLEKALQAQDLRRTGFIDVKKLWKVLASFGFRLTQFKFNSVVKLLFELRGTNVEYAQVIHLLSLMQQECYGEEGIVGQQVSMQPTMASSEDLGGMRLNRQASLASYRHFPLLNQSNCVPEPGLNDYMLASTPSLRKLPDGSSVDGNSSRRRGYAGAFLSSRAVHSMYNLQGASSLVEELRSNSPKSIR